MKAMEINTKLSMIYIDNIKTLYLVYYSALKRSQIFKTSPLLRGSCGNVLFMTGFLEYYSARASEISDDNTSS